MRGPAAMCRSCTSSSRRCPFFGRRFPVGDGGRRGRLRAGDRGGGSDKCGAIPMDSPITAAARSLAAGDPLAALNRIALRDDAPALALRGIAMAQLGELARAKVLLRRAARGFGSREAVARARCVVAEAEIALVSRELGWSAKALDAARATLEAHGDALNAAHAGLLEVRRLLLIGRLDEAGRKLARLDPAPFPPAARAAYELVVAGIAMRRLRTKAARAALGSGRARRAPGRHSGAGGGGRERRGRPRHARGASDRARARSPSAAGGGRGAAGVGGAGRGCVPARRADGWHGGPARPPSGGIRPRPRPRRGVAGGYVEGRAGGAGIPGRGGG